VAIIGDSVAWTLGEYLPSYPGVWQINAGVQGCGIARLPDIRYADAPHTNYPGCDRWDQRWRTAVDTDDPDVSVILLDRWELMERRINGRYQHLGDPDYDAYVTGELDLAVSIAAGRGARVVLLTAHDAADVPSAALDQTLGLFDKAADLTTLVDRMAAAATGA
jgi:hypothetical protein